MLGRFVVAANMIGFAAVAFFGDAPLWWRFVAAWISGAMAVFIPADWMVQRLLKMCRELLEEKS